MTLNRLFCLLLLVLFARGPICGQTPRAAHALLLVGNLADIDDLPDYGAHLYQLVQENIHTRAILITGDLIHPDKPFREEIEEVQAFLEALKGLPVRIIFLPGDRDWDNNDVNGLEMVQLIEDLVDNGKHLNVEWPLQNGCPGPVQLKIASDLSIVAINTQWWNHRFKKPTPEMAICDIASADSFFEELEDILDNTSAGNLVIAGHHPLLSNGKYGGRFPLHDWLLPIPVVSSMKTAFRQNIGGVFETANERFEPFKKRMLELFAETFSAIYVSGHERNIEVLRDGKDVHISSGIPERKGFVAKTRNTAYASGEPGVLSLYFDHDGAAYTIMHAYSKNGFTPGPQAMVFQPPCENPKPGIAVNERLVPCMQVARVLPEMVNKYEPQRRVVLNPDYEASGLQQFFLGQHYRDSWTTPVKLPLLDLDDVNGGLIPYQIGGGRQTVTLKLKAGDGYEYLFRSLDKDPSRGLQPEYRSTLLSVVLRDQTTSQQPFGALVVSKLLDQTDILHPRPSLYIMPDDPKLGPFQPMFGNMPGILEERPRTGEEPEKTNFGADEIRQTIRMYRSLYQDLRNHIDIEEYLIARMLDIWIGDWARHEDNWKWAGYRQHDGSMRYRPIPNDRDHAFSLWDGLFPWLADREWASASGESFEKEIRGIKSLTWKSRHMDRFLANEMEKKDWVLAARQLQHIFNDSLIRNAIHQMPGEIIAADGLEIIDKLKARLADLDTYAEAYYNLLAKEVDIPGSVEDEFFEVKRNLDGSVTVNIYVLADGERGKRMYHRRFIPRDTDEIRLFGLRGDDRFEITGNVLKSIPVRIIPGVGNDFVRDQSVVERGHRLTVIYDNENVDPIIPGPETVLSRSRNPQAYRYRRTAFRYNTYFPLSFLYFTGDDGLILKGGIQFTNQTYGKQDFSSIHRVNAGISTIGNFQFGYEGTWRHVFGKWDLHAGAKIEQRNRFRYFFGRGNTTTYDVELLRAGYYTLGYRTLQVHAGLLNSFWKRSHIMTTVSLERNTEQRNANTILDLETEKVLGQSALVIGKAQFELDLDFRNRKHLPTRGMRFYTNHMGGLLLNEDQTFYGINLAEMEYFGTAWPFTLGIRGGAMLHHGALPFYDRYYIGQNSHLRGYRRNRFTSEQMLYLNTDLRVQLIEKKSASIPWQLGLKLFADAGHVSIDDSASNQWHLGYGAGLYLVPVKEKFVCNFLFGFSKEESGLFILSVGRDF